MGAVGPLPNFERPPPVSWPRLLIQPIDSYPPHLDTVLFMFNTGKATPLQAWTGPESSRRVRFPEFKTIGIWRW